MLDNETKRRIDTARDILVGKVPDPKSQVEQITIALVYKFMDDMDKEAVELGGKPSFFTGDYERYAWSKIFDPRIGGYEMLGLYGEAIVKLNQNPDLPQLFRDIFKNAYLPYRDPETLKLFLKTINEFSYDHSERLGDAFEYLLSVLGSQGDAGQFRTPRHIIDFMVQVVSPQKHETVMDPACGTAGFLISSYKHILKENFKKNPGDLLTTEERKKLLTNFRGYDISPDMVRLSLVNMYLHGFVQPQIMEYDTLTSEDRWNEYADVILANPPFMTPKGGIKPHKKFSVQSNRSEVLFVDYIAEHLTPTGRAAVIVPEGIIFQSATAYKALRKMLVENNLYAVVSLPAGIFNPYSGVKTSILLMDRQLSKKTDSILFVKIENDGYGLGAQRREIDKNDLPDAVNVIRDYVTAVRNVKPETYIAEEKPCGALLVKKDKLAENGEYNLTGDRYKTTETRKHQKWLQVELGDVIDFYRGVTYSKEDESDEQESKIVLRANNIDLNTGKLNFDDLKKVSSKLEFKETQLLKKNDILICTASGSADHIGKVGFAYTDYPYYFGGFMGVVRSKEMIDPYYLYLQLKNEKFRQFLVETSIGANIRNLNYSIFSTFKIPLPPLEVQREIVAEIEGYQKLIDGCRQVVDSWKPQIDIDPEWPMVKLGDFTQIICGGTPSKQKQEFWVGKIPWVSPKDMKSDFIFDSEDHITEQAIEDSATKLVPRGTILIVVRSGILQHTLPIGITTREVAFNQDIQAILPENKQVNHQFLFYILKTNDKDILNRGIKPGVTVQSFHNGYFKEYIIPLPPLEVQLKIVAKIESERKVIDGCRKMIKIYEDKIKHVIYKVWEE